MNIVFWSPVKGQGNVTSSMIAVGGFLAATNGRPIAMMQLRYKTRDLQQIVSPISDPDELEVLKQLGTDTLVRTLSAGLTDTSTLRNYSMALMKKKLDVYPSTFKKNKKIHDEELTAVADKLFSFCGRTYDYTLIDAGGGSSELVAELIACTDLLVVCVNQSKLVLDSLSNYKFPMEKTFFLLTDYDKNSILSSSNVVRQYKGLIKSKAIATVPHCTAFADAMNSGSVLKFCTTNAGAEKSSGNYEFSSAVAHAITSIKKAVNNAVLKQMGEAEGVEEEVNEI